MHRKGSRKWFKRVAEEWARYVGDHATLPEYTRGGAPFLERLRGDLKEWWAAHPDPARRLTAEEIEAIARRLADYIDLYTSPMTSPETFASIMPEWVASTAQVPPDPRTAGLSPMLPYSKKTLSADDTGEDDTREREPGSQ